MQREVEEKGTRRSQTISRFGSLSLAGEAEETKDVPVNCLMLSVQPHSVILMKNAEYQRQSGPKLVRDRTVFWPFCKGSGELYLGVMLGFDGASADRWFPSKQLSHWKITEDEAFSRAFQNLDASTPEKISCCHVKTMDELLEPEKTIRPEPDHITHLDSDPQKSCGMLLVFFDDGRALARLLLPRVVEQLAEVLRCCDPVSLVVLPVSDKEFAVASAEDRVSMLSLASRRRWQLHREGDSDQGSTGKLPSTPFRVSYSIGLEVNVKL